MRMTDETRAAIVAEAKTWVGTPYRGWSRVKGAGVDCGQFLYAVYRALDLIPETELPKDYALDAARHQESTEYVGFVGRYFREITEAEVKPGDVVVYKLGLAYGHAALVVSWPDYVLHAIARSKKGGVSGAHGTRFPHFRTAERRFFTLREA